jgi:hypothetical protein
MFIVTDISKGVSSPDKSSPLNFSVVSDHEMISSPVQEFADWKRSPQSIFCPTPTTTPIRRQSKRKKLGIVIEPLVIQDDTSSVINIASRISIYSSPQPDAADGDNTSSRSSRRRSFLLSSNSSQQESFEGDIIFKRSTRPSFVLPLTEISPGYNPLSRSARRSFLVSSKSPILPFSPTAELFSRTSSVKTPTDNFFWHFNGQTDLSTKDEFRALSDNIKLSTFNTRARYSDL